MADIEDMSVAASAVERPNEPSETHQLSDEMKEPAGQILTVAATQALQKRASLGGEALLKSVVSAVEPMDEMGSHNVPSPILVTDGPIPVTDDPILVADLISVTDDSMLFTDGPTPVTDGPVIITDDPVVVTDDPILVTNDPVPVTDDSMPVTNDPVADADDSILVTHDPTPVTDDPILVTDGPIPVTDDPIPVTDDPIPVTDYSMPTTDGPTPVTDDPVPVPDGLIMVTDGLTLVTGGPTPVTDAPMPVTDGLILVTDDPILATGCPTPVTDCPIRVTGDPVPVNDSQTPVADGPVTVSNVVSPIPPQALTTDPSSSNLPDVRIHLLDNGSLFKPEKSESTELTSKKSKISKADFEIISSLEVMDSKRKSRTVKAVDAPFSKKRPRKDSEDTDGMFSDTERDKKKRKTISRQNKIRAEKTHSDLLEHNISSDYELSESSRNHTPDYISPVMSSHDNEGLPSQKNVGLEKRTAERMSCFDVLSTSFLKNITPELNPSNASSSYHNKTTENVSVNSDLFTKDVANDEISNTSHSSSKGNVQNIVRNLQKLPKPNQMYYDTVRNIATIKNVFLPCFVVIENMNTLQLEDIIKELHSVNTVLPLSERVKALAHLCKKGLISCRKRKTQVQIAQFVYSNVSDTNPIATVLNNEVETSGSRNLRKRYKNIRYAEHSEDIFDEFSKRRSHSKNSFEKAENKTNPECKKRKTHDSSDCAASKKILTSNGVELRDKAIISALEKNRAEIILERTQAAGKDYKKGKPQEIVCPRNRASKGSQRSSSQQIIVFPRTGVSSHVASSLLTKLSSQPLAGKTATVLSSPCFTAASNRAIPGLASQLTASVPVSKPGFTTTTTSASMSTPQFYIMKVNGKDVLFQQVIPNGAAVPVASLKDTSTAVSLVCNNVTNPITQQTAQLSKHQSTITQSQASVSSSSPAQSWLSIPIKNIMSPPRIPRAPKPAEANAQIASQTNHSTLRPVTLVRPQLSQTFVPGLPSPPSTLSATTTSMQNQAPVLSMTSPSNSTVVRAIRAHDGSLRVLAPSQADAFRSVRILFSGTTPGQSSTLVDSANILVKVSSSSDHSSPNKLPPNHLTFEERLAKRRRLEKKYPLPPGVVIKTEPLDPAVGPSLTAVKSLLSQNLLPAHIGSALQNIRINPAPSGSISLPNLPGSSLRVLVPTSLGYINIATATTTSATASSSYSSSSTSMISASACPLSQVSPVATQDSRSPCTENILRAISSYIPGITPNSLITCLSPVITSSSSSTAPLTTSQGLATVPGVESYESSTVSEVRSCESPEGPIIISCESLAGREDLAYESLAGAEGIACESLAGTDAVAYESAEIPADTSSSILTPREHSEDILCSIPILACDSTTDSPITSSASSYTATSHESTTEKAATISLSPPPNLSADSTITSCTTSQSSSELGDIHVLPIANSSSSSYTSSATITKLDIDQLSKFIQKQESCGLKGERLEKLKELLHKKEDHYRKAQKQRRISVLATSIPETVSSTSGDVYEETNQETSSTTEEHPGSHTDPYIID